MNIKKSNKQVLVIAPHPDDEFLGCGGSIINHVKDGNTVNIIYLSLGENGGMNMAPEDLGNIRMNEAINAAAVAEISKDHLHFFGIPDGEIEPTEISSMKQLMKAIRTFKPQIVYIPHEKEGSYDHQRAHVLCWRAITMASSKNYCQGGDEPWWANTVLAYEVWTPIANYQYSEDVTQSIEAKVKALECYASQAADNKGPSTYIGEAAMALPAYRGAMSIGGYREVFQVLRISNL